MIGDAFKSFENCWPFDQLFTVDLDKFLTTYPDSSSSNQKEKENAYMTKRERYSLYKRFHKLNSNWSVFILTWYIIKSR